MSAISYRGQLTGTRKPGLDARVSFELSKIIRSIPNITKGSIFPPRANFGDFHFFTGEAQDTFQPNNWYVNKPDGDWQSMNATNLVPENFQAGTIPSGVKIADYLSLLGGEMAGDIIFASTQKFKPEQMADGIIPSGVTVAGALAATGGTLTGSLGMSHHDIQNIRSLFGLTSDIEIDMNTDGTLVLSAATLISLISASVTIATLVSTSITVTTLIATAITTATLHVTDDITLDDDMVLASGSVLTWATDTNLYRGSANVLKTDDTFISANVKTGAIIDQDVQAGSAPNLLGTNFKSYNIVCDDDEVIVSEGEVVYA